MILVVFVRLLHHASGRPSRQSEDMHTLITQTLARDLSPAFIAAAEDSLRWGYDQAYGNLANPAGGFSRRSPELDQFHLDTILRGRRDTGKLALIRACDLTGTPYQMSRLHSNGRTFIVAQLGQLLVISEPIRFLSDRPLSADYKIKLASTHFSVRQLEMDLGDGYKQRIDARNTMLVFLQHGMSGDEFSRRGTALSMFRVAVPNCNLDSWMWFANALNDDLALRLDWVDTGRQRNMQEDNVRVALRAATKLADGK
jgi:hypothetical protein